MLKKILFCAICFVGMVVGEILARYADKWFASRTGESSVEIPDNQGAQEDINNLKSKIDGR